MNKNVKKVFDDFIDEENIQNDENLKKTSKPKFISNRTGLIERVENERVFVTHDGRRLLSESK